MKPFEIPIIEIDRFELVDTIAVSLMPGPVEILPTTELPEDEFKNPGKMDKK